MNITEDVKKMTEEEFELGRGKLCELYHDSDDIVKKWQPVVERYVNGHVWLYPVGSKEKSRDEQGRFVNTCSLNDDNFAADFYEFEDEFLLWSETVSEVLGKFPPRFHIRFEYEVEKASRFSAKYDGEYKFIGDVPDFLQLYDEFCKEREALKCAEFWVSEGVRSIISDEDVAFELKYNATRGRLYLNNCLVKRCQLYSTLDEALQSAFTNEKHEAKAPSKIKPSISAIKMPSQLRNLMFRVGGGIMRIHPRITYGELKMEGLDEQKLTRELMSTCIKEA